MPAPDVTVLAAYAYILAILGVVGFQVALISGAPWGRLTQGGQHEGALPTTGRVAAGISIVLLLFLAGGVASAAGLWPGWPEWTGWAALVIQVLSMLANWATRSRPERRLWGPITTAMTALSLVTVLGGTHEPERAAEPDWTARYNILWLVAEDLSPRIPAFGDSTVATPNLDRLSQEGVRYTHVFSTSGVCSPSRAALATGMYQNRIGAMHHRTGDGEAPGLPDSMRRYEAMPPPSARMHSEYMRMEDYFTSNHAKTDYQFRAPVTAWDIQGGSAPKWEDRKPGQPFFTVVNFGVTHESQVWARAEDSLWVDPMLEVPVPPYLPDSENAVRDIRRVYSNIVEMDFQVGRVLDRLEAEGLLDSTIVFWFGDHGGPLPREKREMYDSGLRVPLIIRFPDSWRAGEVDQRLISFVDFLPTLLSIAGVKPPEGVDGQPFEGAFRSKAPRAYVHAAVDRQDETFNRTRAVRDQRYKYIRHYFPEDGMYVPIRYRDRMAIMQELHRLRAEGALTAEQALWFREVRPEEELFDIEADPFELVNLALSPAYQDKLIEMRKELDRWTGDINDRGLIPEADYVRSIWPEGVPPRTAAPTAARENGMVSLKSATDGASLGYRLLNDAQGSWRVYTGPFHLESGQELMVVAHRIGFIPSDTTMVFW